MIKKNALKYLGYLNNQVDQQTDKLLNECLLEIEKLKAEQEMRQRSHHILLPSDFQSISYLTKTMNDLPIELRNYK